MKQKVYFLLTCVLSIIVFSTAEETEVQDVTTIYIIHPKRDSYEVDIEIHAQRNAYGHILANESGGLLVPATSSIGDLQCLLSSSPCTWTINGTWASAEVSGSDFGKLSLETPDSSCLINNGGCQAQCTHSPHGPVQCSCPQHYTLTNNKMCSPTSNIGHVLFDDSGTFGSPNYPSAYPNGARKSWLITTSKNKQIKLIIAKMMTESGYDFVTVDSGIRNESWSGRHFNLERTSSKNFMMVYFTTDGSNVNEGFRASYTTVSRNIKALKLESAVGYMKHPLNDVPEDMCLSLVYKSVSSGSLQAKVEHASSKYTMFSQISKKMVNGWTISQHKPEGSLDISDIPINLIVTWTKANIQVLNIRECNSEEEDVYTLDRETWTEDGLAKLHTAPTTDRSKCSNGGAFHMKSGVCVCPPGFTGEHCEEACGPNRYGFNCTGVCSWFGKGCRRMIFCNNYNICTCATGFSGIDCDNECKSTEYGPNCSIRCGECRAGSCDSFTGKCHDGCKDGYYPPNCQDRYITAINAPRLEHASWFDASITVDVGNVTGKGSPNLYVIQYKESYTHEWINTEPQLIPDIKNITVNLNGLKAGRTYISRIILISEDGNSYEGPQIPTLQFETICDVPNSDDFNLTTSRVTTTSFTAQWNYIPRDKLCPVESYDVILEERWRKFRSQVSSNEKSFQDLWPYRQYRVFVCARTRSGTAPCSSIWVTTSQDISPGMVKNLKIDQTSARNIHISWRRPLFPKGVINGYRIQYQCLKYIGCNSSCSHSQNTIETTHTSAILAGLLPYSQYKIRVAATTIGHGRFQDVFAMTDSTIPDNAPVASDVPVISVTNSSAIVQWKPPSCFGLNGNFKEFFITVSPEIERSNITFTGRSTNTSVTITGLRPKTDYEVDVFTVNTHGWNPDYKLMIPLSTRATVPDAVTNLEVYKKGRRMIGLRWAKPNKIYGALKSFTVIYRSRDGGQSFTKIIPPTPCSIWPDLYCYTIHSNLQSDKHYVITVKARNDEINEDGIGAEITTQCRENAPEAPSYLNIVEADRSSVVMEWGVPKNFNGELRSFLVNVEHIDAISEEECCEYFPVQELPFREENSQYSLQVDGLVPASTYIASVSAKTILLGPSANATFQTAPSTVSVPPPQVSKTTDGNTYSVKVIRSPEILNPKLKSLYLLLVLHDHANVTSNIWKNDLLQKLKRTVGESEFYIASEFQMDELSEQTIVIGRGGDVQNGTLGEIKDPVLVPGSYRIGLALLLSFRDATSISFTEGDIFTVA